MIRRELEGWAHHKIAPVWSFGDTVGFLFSIYKNRVQAEVGSGKENVRKVKVVVEIEE